MNQFPIDANVIAQGTELVAGIEPVTDFDTGAQKRDRDGIPKWRIQIVYKPQGQKRQLVEISFTSATEPVYEPGSLPVFSGLIGRAWSNENQYGFSSGVALSAEKVGFRTAPAANTPPAQKQRPGQQAA